MTQQVVIRYLPFKMVLGGLLCALPLLCSFEVWFRNENALPLLAYAGASLWGFYLYGHDKRSAALRMQRVPENRLHLFELLGGWPGALFAQQVFRHKTRKVSYQIVFWCIVSAHQLFWYAYRQGLLSNILRY